MLSSPHNTTVADSISHTHCRRTSTLIRNALWCSIASATSLHTTSPRPKHHHTTNNSTWYLELGLIGRQDGRQGGLHRLSQPYHADVGARKREKQTLKVFEYRQKWATLLTPKSPCKQTNFKIDAASHPCQNGVVSTFLNLPQLWQHDNK